MIDIDALKRDKRPQSSTLVHALIDRLEAAESEALEEARLNGMGSEREAALMAKLEAAERERDELRALVVMRFDHDYPPQFTQGHDLHELTEPVTAEHCRWFVAEIERLRTDCDALRSKIEAMEKQGPVAWARKLGLDVPSFGCVTDLKYRPSNIPESSYIPLYTLPGAKGE